jgi:hypothetical protein
MAYYAISTPTITIDETLALVACEVQGKTPTQEGYARFCLTLTPTYGDNVLECTGNSEFVLPSGELLGVFA